MSDLSDGQLLADILEHEEITESEREAFSDMAAGLLEGRVLSRRSGGQREWVERVHARLVPAYENLVSRGLVPRGREVPTPEVLKNLPLKPPGRA